jgi:hypothetical protein
VRPQREDRREHVDGGNRGVRRGRDCGQSHHGSPKGVGADHDELAAKAIAENADDRRQQHRRHHLHDRHHADRRGTTRLIGEEPEGDDRDELARRRAGPAELHAPQLLVL